MEERILTNDDVYLEGPKPRILELGFAWKVFWEFIRSFRTLHFVGPCITVFGSARTKPGSFYYTAAEEFGKQIAAAGFTTLTGGGPGIMEAANKGAFESGGTSVGINIVLPHEQSANPYLTKGITMQYFFTRKVLLVKYSYAFVVLPGGFGTMDEFFEALTLVQTKTITQFPIILFGTQFYQPLYDYMQKMVAEGMASAPDLNYVLLTDSIPEAMNHVKKYVTTYYTVKQRRKIWWLFEPK